MSDLKQKELLGLDNQELTAIVHELKQPAYRARQLFEAIYHQRAVNLGEVSTLPKQVRELLVHRFSLRPPQIERKFVSADGTIRYLILMADGQSVETVWMPEGDSGESGDGTEAGEEEQRAGFDRATICVSSQVGCAVGCQFCMTALLGAKRSLSAGEIVGQVMAVLNDRAVSTDKDRINLVFMGMGEPFLNYDNFMKAVRLLVEGVGIPQSRMTVSTAGIVPRIYDFSREQVRPKLAISLNASNDEQRDRLMPINRKWNLEALLQAAREFALGKRERLTFEYVLLRDVNDAPENACEVAKLLRGLRCKVNLIALNPGPEIPFSM
ncbi:MAG TPA: 23S rRNA (adenine(2503)-C(2))-methyltransferase RlmN, partial [Terriglobales bacterium]|nr:23S rRNA (adenine(2503)-C(2))-methyltransferase RlmN [Terriglobales bacterium]